MDLAMLVPYALTVRTQFLYKRSNAFLDIFIGDLKQSSSSFRRLETPHDLSGN